PCREPAGQGQSRHTRHVRQAVRGRSVWTACSHASGRYQCDVRSRPNPCCFERIPSFFLARSTAESLKPSFFAAFLISRASSDPPTSVSQPCSHSTTSLLEPAESPFVSARMTSRTDVVDSG